MSIIPHFVADIFLEDGAIYRTKMGTERSGLEKHCTLCNVHDYIVIGEKKCIELDIFGN